MGRIGSVGQEVAEVAVGGFEVAAPGGDEVEVVVAVDLPDAPVAEFEEGGAGGERLDQRALAAAVLTDEERDTGRDVEPAVGDDPGDTGNGVRPLRKVRRARLVGVPVDAFEVPSSAQLGHQALPT